MVVSKHIISKTLFVHAHECLRRFWHEVHRPELVPPPDDAERGRMESGRVVGNLARLAYPNGIMIEPGPNDAERTLAAMNDPNVPAIYEATFRTPGEVARVDVLRRGPNGEWDLIEVKATSRVKDSHKLDVAFQLRLLRQNGVPVRDVFVAHPDPDYVRGQTIDPAMFLVEVSLYNEAQMLQPSVERDLAYFHAVLESPVPPPETGLERCTCSFHTRLDVEHPIDHLPFLSQKARTKLAEANITRITDIPPDFQWLSERQMRVRNAVVSGEPYFDHEALAQVFAKVEYPLRFLDFETFQPAVPPYPGTRPFQTIPFQWSLHSLHADGRIEHSEFIHADKQPPFYAFGESLLTALESDGTIVVYSSHERETLRSLAAQTPELRAGIFAAIDRQLDLLKVMRANVYYPQFHGSYSLKKVLPILASDLGYGDLEIRNGAHAAAAFEEMLRAGTSGNRDEELRLALLRYCARDTEALLRIYQALWQEVQRRRRMVFVPQKPTHVTARRR